MYTVYRFISTSACDDLSVLDLVKSRSEAFHTSDLGSLHTLKACNLRYSHKNISSLQPKLIPQCLHMYDDQIDYILALRICTAHPGALILHCSLFSAFRLIITSLLCVRNNNYNQSRTAANDNISKRNISNEPFKSVSCLSEKLSNKEYSPFTRSYFLNTLYAQFCWFEFGIRIQDNAIYLHATIGFAELDTTSTHPLLYTITMSLSREM